MQQTKNGYIPVENINLDHLPHIKGYDFNKKFSFERFMKSFSTTGFQATNLGKAIETIKAMIREKATIFLAFTSNMVTSGNREIIRYLVEHKLVHAIITTAGGIEEDVIKSLKPFVLGSFDADGKYLFEKGVNRTGNIFVTNDRYTYFEKFMNPFLKKISNKALCASEILNLLGKEVKEKDSVLHWATKNNIPVFCPALTDGAFGDLLFFEKQRNKKFQVDIVEDMNKIVNICLHAKKTGVIILGGGTAKHYALNAQIFRDGTDYAVYINTGAEFDGSDSGASTDEAVTWGKIKPDAVQVKVSCDATIAFPLVMAGVLSSKRS
ncbi:deoxyhypusine synthase [Candidatus Woesearchaeota archaeon]|nr:deoxyhypusine synthase [Candidatus Woesearchaeota archaeon]